MCNVNFVSVFCECENSSGTSSGLGLPAGLAVLDEMRSIVVRFAVFSRIAQGFVISV